VEQLLLLDPENAELAEMYSSLGEVITLTKDLLADAKQQHGTAGPSGARAAAAAAAAATSAPPVASTSSAALGASQIAMPAQLSAPAAALQGNVADQIKKAQQRSALAGQAPAGWAVGAECLAYYATDAQWYPARVESVTEGGNFVVVYEGYGNTEEVSFWSRYLQGGELFGAFRRRPVKGLATFRFHLFKQAERQPFGSAARATPLQLTPHHRTGYPPTTQPNRSWCPGRCGRV